MVDLKESKFIRDMLDVYSDEKLIKSYDITDKIIVNVCKGIDTAEIEEMISGALYVEYQADSYSINVEVRE
ncbi:hypothetical protein [Clostridium beijerinckii]|uniref:hypothetical protein n=1 Tax=Clostridium beijerinckii TaxID=1520 RepID=UPI0003D2A314|nr:hypothetical protein [Clostridium beijerinckii]ALB47792.1 hypothetical protein X276_22240 [Clostridium beijerinckii NRRL B-598]